MLLHRSLLLSSSVALALLASACKDSAPKETPKPAEQVKPAEPAKPVEAAKPAATATAAAVAAVAQQPAAEAVAGGSGIVGVVKFDGPVPPARAIDMSKDPSCVKMNAKPSIQDVLVSNGNLEGVFVYVKSGLPEGQTYPVKTEKVVLDQKGCLYHPVVLGVQVGQPLQIVNSDALLHNVHAFAKGANEFNQAMPKQGQTIEKKLKKAQVMVPVKCEVHPWMQSWIGVVDHPFFAVTDASGAFELKGLPKGTYELGLVHPTLGEQTTSVTVNDGAASKVSVTFKAKS